MKICKKKKYISIFSLNESNLSFSFLLYMFTFLSYYNVYEVAKLIRLYFILHNLYCDLAHRRPYVQDC